MYRDRGGAMLPARLDEASLRDLAAAGGGRYATLSVDGVDLRALGVLGAADPAADAATGRGAGQRVWLDQGYWLLLPLLLLAALAFRRGAGVLAVLPLAVMFSLPSPAQAAEGTGDGSWWRRPDQQAQTRISQGVDAYRQGDFASAEQDFDAAGARGAEAQYNLGNALARQGRYDEAIAAYDRALAQSPGMEDAVANRRVVDAARRQQPPQGGKGGQNRPQPGQDQAPPQDGPAQDGPPQESGQASPDSGDEQQPKDGQQQGGDRQQDAQPPQAEDAQARERQEQADREQRERMQRALEQGQDPQSRQQARPTEEDAQAREQRQAREAWLRRVPDDPGGLLRAKFRLEYERRQQEGR
jgi:Ca-activated chloride channel family protein